MAGKNEVTLTFAGDHDQLQRTFDKVGAGADQMAREVGQASDRVSNANRSAGDSFDRVGEAADTVDTRAMGFRDTMTGVQDSMLGVSNIAKGDLFEGFFLLGAGVGDLGSGIYNTLIPSLKGLSGSFSGVRSAMRSTVSFMTGPWGIALLGAAAAAGLVVVAWQAWNAESKRAEERQARIDDSTKALTGTLNEHTGAITENTRATLAAEAHQAGALDLARERGIALDTLIDAILGEASATREVNQALDALTETEGLSTGQKAEHRIRADELRRMMEELGIAVESSQAQWELEQEAIEGATGEVETHMHALDALADQLKAQTDPMYAFIKAQDDLAEAQAGVTEAAQEHGRRSPEYQDALREESRAALDLLAAAGALADGFEGELSEAQEQMLRDAGLSEDALERLREDLRGAKRDVDNLDGSRARLTIQTSYTTIGQPPAHTSNLGAGFQQFNHAGGNMLPGWGWVGERGPELMRVDTTTPILSNSDSRRLASSPTMGGDGAAVHLTVSAGRSGTSAEQAMADLVVQMIRTGALALETRDGRVVVAGGA